MRNTRSLFTHAMSWALYVCAFALVFTACTDDGVDPPPTAGPNVSSFDLPSEASADSVVSFTITTSTGDALLQEIQITEEGISVDAGRLSFEQNGGGVEPFGANPKLLNFAEFEGGFTWTVFLQVHPETSTAKDYNIRLLSLIHI